MKTRGRSMKTNKPAELYALNYIYYISLPMKCQHQISSSLYSQSNNSNTNFISQLFGGSVK